ncbi:MAG: cytochrome c peroxidase, partial [Bacteroidota bacterium]
MPKPSPKFTQLWTIVSFSLVFLWGCNDSNIEQDDLDETLSNALIDASNGQGLSYFTFPESTNYASIPQDPNNPITDEKVALGKLLFHETGIGVVPKNGVSTQTYSCASCHHAAAGFQAGIPQGIGEGGLGFGLSGEGRRRDLNYIIEELDVQDVRSPSAMNVAYQTNMLWNGQFGATGVNIGTEAQWTPGTPKAENTRGFEGVEIQAIAGMDVHRLAIENSVCKTDPTYLALFEAAYPDIPADQRVNLQNAALAIAAYERTLLANEAPFQRWLKGENDALTDLEKEGAILFFGKANCVSCHTGPALNSMEFYALGMNDLYQ